jgi:hypothetical protein
VGNQFVYNPTRRKFLHAFLSTAAVAPLIDLFSPMPAKADEIVDAATVPAHKIKFTNTSGNDQGAKVLLLFMQGGLSFFDSFDPKTASGIKGPFKPIETKAKGVHITEPMAPLAKHMDKFIVLNNLFGGNGFHDMGAALVMTGSSKTEGNSFYVPAVYTNPLVEFSQMLTNDSSDDVGYVVLHQSSDDVFGYKRHWDEPWDALKPKDPETIYSPYDTKTGLFVEPGFANKSISPERARERIKLLERIEQTGHVLVGKSVDKHDRSYRKAKSLMFGDFRDSFRIENEPQESLKRYGDSKVGRQLLLARRMLEKKTRVVVANDGNYDHHGGIEGNMNLMIKPFSQALAAFMDDIEKINNKVYVVIVTEFGRTPMINYERGRDHWTDAFGMVVAGNTHAMKPLGGGRTIGVTGDDGKIIGGKAAGFHASMVGETILELMGLGRFEMRGDVVTRKRFPYIDLKNERAVT